MADYGRLEQLIDRIKGYKIGSYEKFGDALPGEMEGFRLNIGLFGMTGSGKSALINTIFQCLGLQKPAMVQTSGKEGTRVLESFNLPGDVTLYDTAGFFHLGKIEEGELFRIVYGIERPGDDLKRDASSARKAKEGGVGAYKYKKPPIADQMHVFIWVISAVDVRFEQGKYRENINFVQHQLQKETITVITVITFDDEVGRKKNADEVRKKFKQAAIEVSGSDVRNVFLVANSLRQPEDYSLIYMERVMEVVETALKCGERSVKIRQSQRERSKAVARREATCKAEKVKKPEENTYVP